MDFALANKLMLNNSMLNTVRKKKQKTFLWTSGKVQTSEIPYQDRTPVCANLNPIRHGLDMNSPTKWF